MTVAEFKTAYPQYAHLEGEALWNTMEDVFGGFGCLWSEKEIEEYKEKHKDEVAIVKTDGYTFNVWPMPGFRTSGDTEIKKEL